MSEELSTAGPVTVLLIRHGRSIANSQGLLAGRMPGVSLDERGLKQSTALVEALGKTAIEFLVHSDLERTRETIKPLAHYLEVPMIEDSRITECDYGDWTGKRLGELSKEPLWTTVQSAPSEVTFPGGESMIAMQTRAVECIRDYVAKASSVFAVCSHGDVIKSIVADAIGLNLDKFQTLDVQPASITAVQYFPHGNARLLLHNYPVGETAFSSLSLESQETLGGGDVRA